jgi:hypothetical protein
MILDKFIHKTFNLSTLGYIFLPLLLAIINCKNLKLWEKILILKSKKENILKKEHKNDTKNSFKFALTHTYLVKNFNKIKFMITVKLKFLN